MHLKCRLENGNHLCRPQCVSYEYLLHFFCILLYICAFSTKRILPSIDFLFVFVPFMFYKSVVHVIQDCIFIYRLGAKCVCILRIFFKYNPLDCEYIYVAVPPFRACCINLYFVSPPDYLSKTRKTEWDVISVWHWVCSINRVSDVLGAFLLI